MSHLEFAARVEHHVTHGAVSGTLTLGVAGAVIAAAIVIGTAPESLTVAIVVEAGASAKLWGNVGMAVGGLIDTFQAPSESYQIEHGIPSVLLGTEIKEAARAETKDTWANCEGHGWEGSITVMLGKEFAPMSRRGDRLDCGGTIFEGEKTIFVGGERSHEGKELAEKKDARVERLSAILDWIGLGKDLEEKNARALASFALGRAGYDKTATIVGAPTEVPKDTAGIANAALSARTLMGQ